MYENIIINNKFFENKKHGFILCVLPMLKAETILKGDILISAGDIVEQMYFVIKGLLSLNTGDLLQNIELMYMKKSDYYGDLLIYLNQQSPFELKCKRSSTEVLLLKRNDFLNVVNSYQDEVLDIIEKTSSDFVYLHKKKKLFLQLLKPNISSRSIHKKLAKMNIFLFENGFLNWYNKGIDSFEFKEFLEKNDIDEVKKFIEFSIDCRMVKTNLNEKIQIIMNDSIIDSDNKRGGLVISNKNNSNPSSFDHLPSINLKMASTKMETNVNFNNFSSMKSNENMNKSTFKEEFINVFSQISKNFGSRRQSTIHQREKKLNKKTNQFLKVTQDPRLKRMSLNIKTKIPEFNNKNITSPQKLTLKSIFLPKHFIFTNLNLNLKNYDDFLIERNVDLHFISNNIEKTLNSHTKFNYSFQDRIILPVKTESFYIKSRDKRKCQNGKNQLNLETDLFKMIKYKANKNFKNSDIFYNEDELKKDLKLRNPDFTSVIQTEKKLQSKSSKRINMRINKKLDRMINILDKYCKISIKIKK